MKKEIWKSTPVSVASFLNNEDAVCITIVKTGFADTYIVVYDDAERVLLGETDILSEQQIFDKFGITIKNK